RQRLAEAREALQVRRVEVDDDDRLPARRGFQRPRIQVADLVRREQGEAAPADGAAGEVVRRVALAGGGYPVADPDRRRRLHALRGEIQVVAGAQARQAVVDQQRGDVVGRRSWIVLVPGQLVQHLVEGAAADLAVELGETGLVERAP